MLREKKIIKIAIMLLFAAFPVAGYAQGGSINTFSPYSFYGLGDLSTQGSTTALGMGGVGLGYRSPININYLNPAAYSSANQRSALLLVGLQGQNHYLRSAETKSSFNSFNFRDLALQLPVAKGVGIAFSLTPYSSVGYRIARTEDGDGIWEDIGYVNYLYSGSGGVNRFKLGVGWAITEWLSVGAEAVYYQGNISRNYTQTIQPITGDGTYLGVTSDNRENVNKILANVGLQARLFSDVKKNRSLTLGAVYELGGGLNSKVSELIVHGPGYTPVGVDEVVSRTYVSDFKMPNIFSSGLYYTAPKFSAGLDYTYSGWGVNKSVNDNVFYRNTHTIAAGVQFIPKPGDVRKIMNRWSYRVGARYNQYYMVVNGRNIDETAITLGVGVPVGTRGVNNINLGIELGTRGHTSHGLVRDNYFKISLGVSLFGDDYWFLKYKYD